YVEAEGARIRARLLHEGTSSQRFEQWFVKEKYPQLRGQARQQVPEKGRPSAPVDPLVRAAATGSAEQVLAQARRDPATLAAPGGGGVGRGGGGGGGRPGPRRPPGSGAGPRRGGGGPGPPPPPPTRGSSASRGRGHAPGGGGPGGGR